MTRAAKVTIAETEPAAIIDQPDESPEEAAARRAFTAPMNPDPVSALAKTPPPDPSRGAVARAAFVPDVSRGTSEPCPRCSAPEVRVTIAEAAKAALDEHARPEASEGTTMYLVRISPKALVGILRNSGIREVHARVERT